MYVQNERNYATPTQPFETQTNPFLIRTIPTHGRYFPSDFSPITCNPYRCLDQKVYREQKIVDNLVYNLFLFRMIGTETDVAVAQ